MPTGTYKLSGNSSVVRFFSRNRASTDALSALAEWRALRTGRSFETLEDTDEFIVATLAVSEDDAQAGPDLQRLGEKFGVQHAFFERIGGSQLMRAVQRQDGKWNVVDENDRELAGPFDTEEAALDWIEAQRPKPARPKP